MKSQINISIKLKEEFDTVNSEVTWLHTIWEMYIQLYGTSDENMEVMNVTAPQFFGIIQYALFSELVTTINRLTDKHNTFGKRNASLEQIIKSTDQSTNPELTLKLMTRLKNVENKAKPFRVWRNKKIAHNDLTTALKQNSEILPGITRGQTQNLIDEIVELINEFSVPVLGSTQMYKPFLIHSGDGIELLRILKIAIDNQNSQKE